ncbi:MAG: VIT domain-containing protein [Verrucomicrobiales bacterium]
MKSPARTFALATIFAALCGIVLFSAATTPAGAAEPGGKAEAAAGEIDKTLAPYFVVQSMDGGEQPGPDAFPLKGTAVEARIAGVIAEVEVRQTYANAGSGALEARYIFPASTRAAVHGMEMRIGGRVIAARVEKKAEAKETYAKAKEAGKSASLLEQQRPNIFEMSVANILPGDEIEVALRYTELLVPEGGTYEFAFPGVVAPRYSNKTPAEAPGEAFVANPYLRKGEPTPASYTIDVALEAGMPVAKIGSSSHEVLIDYRGESSARVALNPAEPNPGDRDFLLQYRLAGGEVQAGVLLQPEGEGGGYFLAMAQPPHRPDPAAIAPREYLFVVDVSGSMSGFPLNTAAT